MPGPVAFVFPEPLVGASIVRRKSQFTFDVLLDGQTLPCHCPTTGRIGNLDVAGLPCLVSLSHDPGRKTRGTVEAVSLDLPENPDKGWIGINQNAANRYVEHFLVYGGFEEMVGRDHGGDVQRERFLGESKLDFLVGDTYLEVKTPLQHLQVEVPDWVRTKKVTPFSSTGRMQRHVAELAGSLGSHQRAILLTCFIYDNPGFRVIERSTNYDQVKATVDRSVALGVETWQANFKITPRQVTLEKCFRIEL